MNRLTVCLSIASAAVLAACGSEPEPVASAAPAPKPAAAATVPDNPTLKMARAVGNGKPGAAVEIRYEFQGKPAVGTPTELEVVLIPTVGVDAMDATVSGMDGVTLAGPLTASFSGVEPGKPYTHKLSVLPDRSGVYYITVAVNTQIGGSSLGRTFAIPFAVGNVSAQQKAAPPQDANGQPIESMQAQETRG